MNGTVKRMAKVLVLIAAASVLAGCRNEKQMGYPTDPAPTSLNCDVVIAPGRPAEPGARYSIDVREANGQRVCIVTPKG